MLLFGVLIFASAMLNGSLVSSASHSLPKTFNRCKMTDPNVGKCLEKAVVDAFQKMKDNGIPSLGVFPLEPLQINDINIDPGAGDSPVNLKLHFKNIKMYGLPDTTLSKYNANFKDATLTSEAFIPKLWFEADYTGDGRILLLPIKGEGRCNVTLYELTAGTTLTFKPEEKNGETYWMIQNFKNDFSPKRMALHFNGLFNGDEALNANINQFLNENWKAIFEEMGPSFEEAFGAVFKEITHRVFSKVPISKIFIN